MSDPVRIVTFPVKDVMSELFLCARNFRINGKTVIMLHYKTICQNMPFSQSPSFVDEWLENCRNTEALTDPSADLYCVGPYGEQSGSGGADLWPKMDLKTYKDKWNQIDPKDDEFYKYLERTCQKRETEEEDKK